MTEPLTEAEFASLKAQIKDRYTFVFQDHISIICKLIATVESLKKRLADCNSAIKKQGELIQGREGKQPELVFKLRDWNEKLKEENEKLKGRIHILKLGNDGRW